MHAGRDVQIRRKAVKTILDIHTNISSFGRIYIWPFNIPSISFTAETYVIMIDWETYLIAEPLLQNTLMLLNSVCTPKKIQGYPCPTQAVYSNG